MTLPNYNVGITGEDLAVINSTFDKSFTEVYQNVPVNSDPFVTVKPSPTNTYTFAALTQLQLMRKWIGAKQFNAVAAQAVTVKTVDYEESIQIPRADFLSDKVGIYADIAGRLGWIGKKHQDYQAKQTLQCGWPATQASLYPNESVTTAVLTQDTLFSTAHKLNPNAAATPNSVGGGTDGAAAGNQSNIVSGSFINQPLVAAAWERMTAFTGDQGQILNVQPKYIVHPPQQTTNVLNAIQAKMNPVASAVPTPTVGQANLPLSNVLSDYGLQPVLFNELGDDPNVVYLVGESFGLKALQFPQFIAPHLVPMAQPDNPGVFYSKMFQWSVESNDFMFAPFWPLIIRISILGS